MSWLKTKIKQCWSWTKRQCKKILIGAGIIGIAFAASQLPETIPDELKLKAPKEKIIFNREYKAGEVSYLYWTDNEVLQEQGEDISKRTPNAQFFYKGLKKGKEQWTAKVYSGEPFYKDAISDKWFQTESGTTTLDAFKKQTRLSIIEKLSSILAGKKVQAVYVYTGTGDGSIRNGYGATWAIVHDAAAGFSVDYTGDTIYPVDNCYRISAPVGYKILRGFFPFDTSALGAGSVVSSAKFIIYNPDTVNAADNDAFAYIAVVQNTSSATDQLYLADFDAIGTATGSANYLINTGLTANASNTLTLTTEGIAWIDVVGWTKLGIREGHDIENQALDVADGCNSVNARWNEALGTIFDPYLDITYTVPSVAVEPEMEIILIEG